MNDSRHGTIRLEHVCKQFKTYTAVDDINLSIRSGEFFALLGPSGCGKTTTLRMIAGFERPDSGRIMLDDRDVSGDPPHKRPVNTVFQSYALFPHLNVFDNVAFGLRRLKIKKEEIRRRVVMALEMVELDKLIDSRPTDLSGGQKQRVALARALVLQPAALLLDEPMGALDAKLRRTLQGQLKGLQQELGITFIYVTHDQNEALTMSDRMAVMRDGHIQQVGVPEVIYEQPTSAFVADFLGASNLMSAETCAVQSSGHCRVRIGEVVLDAVAGGEGLRSGSAATKVSIRPERVRLQTVEQGELGQNQVNGCVRRIVYLGKSVRYIVDLDVGGQVEAEVHAGEAGASFEVNQRVRAWFPPENLRVLD